MATETVVKRPAESPLYFHERLGAYECLGCGEFLEVPKFAVLKVDNKIQRVPIRGDALNLILWREMNEIDHEKCAEFQDEAKALDYRQHRKVPHATVRPMASKP